jgi:hypothetical protein
VWRPIVLPSSRELDVTADPDRLADIVNPSTLTTSTPGFLEPRLHRIATTALVIIGSFDLVLIKFEWEVVLL